MAKKTIVMVFPPNMVREPVTYRLVKDFDLMVNILAARVTPNEEGHLVLELNGTDASLAEAMSYLSKLGLRVEALAQDVRWYEERCTHCTACVSICPSEALSVERATMRVSFDPDKCIACSLCLAACPYQAVEITV